MRKFLYALLVAGASTGAIAHAAEPTDLISGIELEHISSTIDPSEDFYEYVNEGWLENTEIPADQSNYGSFSKLDDGVKEAIRNIIEEAAKQDAAEGSDAQKVGDFFKSYTNIELRNELGTKPAKALLAEVDAVTDASSLSKMAASLFRRSIAGPFACYVSVDARKSDQYTVYLTQTGITLPDRDYYLKDSAEFKKARADLEEFIADMMKTFGYDHGSEAAKNIVELETKLAEIFWTKTENRDPVKSYNKHSQSELINALSNFDVATFLADTGISEQEEFIVRQPSYLAGLNELFESTSIDVWKDYYRFQVIDAIAEDLSEEIEKRHFQFHQTALTGVEEQKPRWRRGVEACNGILGEMVGKIYVDKHFPPEAKERMDELVGNLKKAFAKRIVAIDWMSPVTKKQAHEKLSKFTTKIGYPDEWKDYSKLVIKDDDLVGNYLRAAKVEYQKQLDKLGAPIDRNEWFMTPQTINAYYNPTMNEIVFPAAILQPPFFNLEADDAVNYGAIGGVIGHEISHGFDDKGSMFDGDGNLRRWWSEDDRGEFERRAQLLIEQYSGYKPFEDANVNGELTIGENIGDLGGMAVAFEAYKMSLEGKEAPKIDGFTGEQRFFLGWGQIWRRLYREKELRRRLLVDPHSPSQYRCNGILSNMDAFYETFEIEPGSKMYIAPEKRVYIW